MNVHDFEKLSPAEKHAALDKLRSERSAAYQGRKKSTQLLREHLKMLKNPFTRNPFFQHLEKAKAEKTEIGEEQKCS